jgi:hypothetical protein
MSATPKTKGGRTMLDEKMIERIISMKAKGYKPREISEKLDVAIANVYYYTAPAYGKKKPATPKTSETPEKVGEREIDKVDAMLTKAEFDKVREEVGDGIQLDMLRLALPGYSFAELRRARSFDDFDDYKLDYERSQK